MKKYLIILCALFFCTTVHSTTITNLKKIPDGKGGFKEVQNVPIGPLDRFKEVENAPIGRGDNGIQYHGGEVMGTTFAKPVNVYLIWYGAYTQSKRGIIDAFFAYAGNSSYLNILSTYTDGTSHPIIPSSLGFKGEYFDNYSLGKNLTDSNVVQIVANAITNGKFPLDSNGIYFVLTAPDVKETSGFCSIYCGWHMAGVYQNRAYIRVAFIGDPSSQCPSGCMNQSKVSPNNNPAADAMVSIVAHELEESISNPLGNAWYDDSNGQENADKCAWNFGPTRTLPNGSRYNITLNNYLNFLIQENWVNAKGGYCAQKYP